MDEQYISIKKFAELAGVSTQSVYKRLTTSLQPYVKEVANSKRLNIQALHDVYQIQVDNGCKPVSKEVDNRCQPVSDGIVEQLQTNLKEKDAIIENLYKLLTIQSDHSVQDEQIKRLHDEIAALQDTIKNDHEALMKAQENLKEAQENLKREQQLHLLSQQKVIELEHSLDKQNSNQQDIVTAEHPKKSWWQKLFK